MIIPSWATPQLIATVGVGGAALIWAIAWNVATWNVSRRELSAERAKRSDTAVTFAGQKDAGVFPDWRPSQAGTVTAFELFVENLAISQANVHVQVYLPSWMHSTKLPTISKCSAAEN